MAEKCLRFMIKTENILNKKLNNVNKTLINNTLQNLNCSVYDVFGDHVFDSLLDNHSIMLTKLILNKYFNIRIHHECTKINNDDKNAFGVCSIRQYCSNINEIL